MTKLIITQVHSNTLRNKYTHLNKLNKIAKQSSAVYNTTTSLHVHLSSSKFECINVHCAQSYITGKRPSHVYFLLSSVIAVIFIGYSECSPLFSSLNNESAVHESRTSIIFISGLRSTFLKRCNANHALGLKLIFL